MKNLKILGMGCPKCKKLTEQAETAAHLLGLEYEIEKITNVREITSFGVMMTPALVVDGEVKVAGRVPSVEEMKTMLE
ncbi:MAG: TM0996/MTH895 family glutaredoxin-like protein [Candidatus Hydrogenedentes bacterium]|nr:TM0996/MTH895 family glutaredoxin-like protein [Candidatus Hydrogenedentota bacterium]